MLTLLFVGLFFAFLSAVVLVRIARKARRFSDDQPMSDVPIGPVWLGRVIPEDPHHALVTAVVVSALLGVGLVVVGIYLVRQYGWAVFIVTPFVMGFVSASLVSHPASQRWRGARLRRPSPYSRQGWASSPWDWKASSGC
jgi:hypothetical protein